MRHHASIKTLLQQIEDHIGRGILLWIPIATPSYNVSRHQRVNKAELPQPRRVPLNLQLTWKQDAGIRNRPYFDATTKGKPLVIFCWCRLFFWWAEYDAAFLRWVLRSVLSLVRGFVATSFALVSSVTAFEAPCGAHLSSFTGRTMWHPGRCFDIFQAFMFFTHLIQSSSLFVSASHSIYTRTMLVSSPLCYSDLALKTFPFALGIRSVRTSISEKY